MQHIIITYNRGWREREGLYHCTRVIIKRKGLYPFTAADGEGEREGLYHCTCVKRKRKGLYPFTTAGREGEREKGPVSPHNYVYRKKEREGLYHCTTIDRKREPV